MESLAKHLPPVGSSAIENKGPKGKASKKADAKPAASTNDSADRGEKFDKLDVNKLGKLTREYYTTHQSDAAAATDRFNKWDTNKDGLLSRAEYIAQGKGK